MNAGVVEGFRSLRFVREPTWCPPPAGGFGFPLRMPERVANAHPGFARHAETRTLFHEAREAFLEATQNALLAGRAYLENPSDPRLEAAYRAATQAEAEATERLRAAREMLLGSRGPD